MLRERAGDRRDALAFLKAIQIFLDAHQYVGQRNLPFEVQSCGLQIAEIFALVQECDGLSHAASPA
jgi:hypothetical protein